MCIYIYKYIRYIHMYTYMQIYMYIYTYLCIKIFTNTHFHTQGCGKATALAVFLHKYHQEMVENGEEPKALVTGVSTRWYTHCNNLQHTATQCNPMQYIATLN